MAVGTLVFFSLLMATLPLGAFYSVLQGRADPLLQPLLGAPQLEEHRLVVAAALAVLAVNCVVAAFVAAAWLEKPPAKAKGGKAE